MVHAKKGGIHSDSPVAARESATHEARSRAKRFSAPLAQVGFIDPALGDRANVRRLRATPISSPAGSAIAAAA